MSVWHEWRGGSCPTDPNAEVEVRFANGNVSRHSYPARGLRWSRQSHPFDIVAYRVTSVEKVG